MNLRRNCFRPALELLECRDNPTSSNLTVTFANHTLTVHGTIGDILQFEGNQSDATQFDLSSSSGTDTFNGNSTTYSSPSGVQNITIKLQSNSNNADTVFFDGLNVPIEVEGDLSISTGNGDNEVVTKGLTVKKNFSISNGTNSTSNPMVNYLVDLSVGGNLTINNGNGDTQNFISRSSSGISSIFGNLSITNGSGDDENFISDMDFGGNITVVNEGDDSSGIAGYTLIENIYNNTPSVIRGNVSVSYKDGNQEGGLDEGILDTDVLGGVTFNNGSGNFITQFDGSEPSVPDIIHGNLTVTGKGVNSVEFGVSNGHTGFTVGKNLTITGGSDSELEFSHLQVGGTTNLTLGNGGNEVTIDESLFIGAFNLKTNGGSNKFNLDTISTDTLPTQFDNAVTFSLGTGSNLGYIATNGDTQDVIFLNTVVGTGASWSDTLTQIIFPFGGSLDVT